jgi:hypothetical protein
MMSSRTSSLDQAALAADLTRAIRGEVRFDDGRRALYASYPQNSSGNR